SAMPRTWPTPHRVRVEQCPRCGATLEQIEIHQRTAYLCPQCQGRGRPYSSVGRTTASSSARRGAELTIRSPSARGPRRDRPGQVVMGGMIRRTGSLLSPTSTARKRAAAARAPPRPATVVFVANFDEATKLPPATPRAAPVRQNLLVPGVPRWPLDEDRPV